MLTKKHFKAIAEKNREVIEDFSFSKGYSPEQKRIILKALYRMVRAQASWMSSENPNFNWDRFLDASGITDGVPYCQPGLGIEDNEVPTEVKKDFRKLAVDIYKTVLEEVK